MRICIISREYPPETGWGGIATFSRHLAHGLTALGHEVEVVSLAKDREGTFYDGKIPIHRVMPHFIPGELGTVSLCMPYSRYVLRTTTALWKRFIDLHLEKPFDVIDSPELLAEGLIPAVTRVAPLVIRLYTPHSKFIAEQLHNVLGNAFDHQFVAMLERMAMLSADALTSPSRDLAQFVASDLHKPVESIRLIQNPIDTTEFAPEGPLAIERDEKVNVLFVGRLEERKGIYTLVEAIPKVLARCPQARFTIIGDDTQNAVGGQRSVSRDIRESLSRSGSLGSITFIPRVPLTDLPKYYRSADMSVVPSVYDNSPYTCLEAMACGLPVVGSSGGGTPEYVQDGLCGIIVPPKDVDSLAEAIITLVSDNEKRKRFGAQARQHAVRNFDRVEIAKKTAALYEEARSRFSMSKPLLYLKPPEEAIYDASVFLYSYDNMLYNMLYQQSWRFRLKHWWTVYATRPRLLMGRLCLRLARAGSRILRGPAHQSRLVKWLEGQVAAKTEQPMDKIAATCAPAKRM